MSLPEDCPTIQDIEAAAERLRQEAVRTPLLRNEKLDQMVGGKVFIKPEVLQRTGSFKFRGAYNRLSSLSKHEQEAGCVAWSSGNHAQGVAAAARLLGMKATIVMPQDAPEIKIDRTRRDGAEIVFYDRYKESRETIAAEIVEQTGAVLIPSYDDNYIIAGQGTTGLEIASDMKKMGLKPTQFLAPTGGGGLISGSSIALKHNFPEIHCYSVEPENYDDHAKSLESGEITSVDTSVKSLCDALLAPCPGEKTFRINKMNLSGGFVVTEVDVRAAMRFALTELKLCVEPGGAVALATILSGKCDAKDNNTALVLSGGNVDPVVFCDLIAQS